MTLETILLILSSGVAIKLLDIVWKYIERRWLKKDTTSANDKAVRNGVRTLLRDKIRYLCKKYIDNGSVAADDHEDLIGMHKAYHDLGGNGYLDTMMEKVNKLPYKSEE